MNSVFEESLWRGAVLPRLELEGMPRWISVAVASIAFGVAHANGAPPGILGVVLTTLFAVSVSSLALWTRSLVPGMVAHMIADVAILGPLAT